MDMLQDSMMLYAILTGITIVSYMAMGMKMTLGIVVGVALIGVASLTVAGIGAFGCYIVYHFVEETLTKQS